MNPCPRCQNQPNPPPAQPAAKQPASRWRLGREATGWLLPSITLILLPKCPICLAAYVALFTGLGLSFTSASFLRITLLFTSIAVLLYLSLRHLRRLVQHYKHNFNP
jgi:hypothetical protein